jgi:hypothetical protein
MDRLLAGKGEYVLHQAFFPGFSPYVTFTSLHRSVIRYEMPTWKLFTWCLPGAAWDQVISTSSLAVVAGSAKE